MVLLISLFSLPLENLNLAGADPIPEELKRQQVAQVPTSLPDSPPLGSGHG